MNTHERQAATPIKADEITVRLATNREIPRWDRLMRKHHKLGFNRFAGRGLRYVVEYRDRWIALSGWQTGSLKTAGRDGWISWEPNQQWRRLHLIGNNTRFAMLCDEGRLLNVGSRALKLILQRLSDDWHNAYGHGLLVAETYVDPQHHRGTMFDASGWETVGVTAGYSRKNGEYTEAHDQRKRILVKKLRRDAKRILCQQGELALQWQKKGRVSGLSVPELRSLHEDLSQMRDFRRAQGRKHSIGCAFTVLLLAQLSRFFGCLAAAQFAAALSQEELEAVGAWRNPKTGKYEPPSKSTLHRVIQLTDPEQLEEVLCRYTSKINGDCPSDAIAGDGKRIRGANRNGDSHYETVTLVEHGTGVVKACVTIYKDGGELSATCQLIRDMDIDGSLVTLDSLHSTFETVVTILDAGAHYMLTLKDNTSKQLEKVKSMRWSSHKVRRYSEDLDLAHGRLEQRHIEVLENTDPKRFDFKDVRQVFCINRDRQEIKDPDGASTETVYGITSVPADKADAKQLLEWNRGHWAVEVNHHIRDRTLLEDSCLTRTNNGPSNLAMCNNLVLAIIVRENRFDSVPHALRHFNLCRKDAFAALFTPP